MMNPTKMTSRQQMAYFLQKSSEVFIVCYRLDMNISVTAVYNDLPYCLYFVFIRKLRVEALSPKISL